jgi:hypothetical protein
MQLSVKSVEQFVASKLQAAWSGLPHTRRSQSREVAGRLGLATALVDHVARFSRIDEWRVEMAQYLPAKAFENSVRRLLHKEWRHVPL